jgi:hypothetical protein
LVDLTPEQIAERAKTPLLVGTSVKGALDIEWSDPAQKAAAIGTLVEQLDRLERWIARELGDNVAEPPLAEPLATLRQLREQDLDPEPPDGKPRIRKGKLEVNEEVVRFTESRINLGKGRGRVRRISVLHDDGRQVNLLAVSEEPAERLIGVMAGRWCQENAFKHGVERWGINQLDGRTTDPYPSDTIIPNPARRRLDRALRIARVREGDARTALAKLDDGDPRREKWERQLKEASAAQAELLALRPSVPTYAALADTELKDKLVKHELEYKMTVDALRIACANVEADLALDLAPRLIRPREAKRVLANVFAAPGRVRVGKRTISITLHPAGTTNELNAIRDWLADLNSQNLVLPADPLRRRLRFQSP